MPERLTGPAPTGFVEHATRQGQDPPDAAAVGPWLHTYMDDFEVVDVNGLTVVAEIVANTIWQIANE